MRTFRGLTVITHKGGALQGDAAFSNQGSRVDGRMPGAPRRRPESNPFKEFVEEMARLTVPEDDTEENRGRREAAAFEVGDANWRARRVRPGRLRRRRVLVLGGAGALGADPQGAGAGRTDLTSTASSRWSATIAICRSRSIYQLAPTPSLSSAADSFAAMSVGATSPSANSTATRNRSVRLPAAAFLCTGWPESTRMGHCRSRRWTFRSGESLSRSVSRLART